MVDAEVLGRIEQAIAEERAAADSYQRLAGLLHEEGQRRLVEAMAREEADHALALELLRGELAGGPAGAVATEVQLLRECEAGVDERPCELTVALGIAQELGRQAGISTTEVDVLEERGVASEREVEQAVRAVVARLPDDMRLQGETLLEAAFGSPAVPGDGSLHAASASG